ncbi:MAG: carboxypeptidase-like regulatory domain-containing protein [Flavobacteriaceae bacterium]
MKNALGILKKLGFSVLLTLAVTLSVSGQDTDLLTLRGKVYDAQSNEPLPLASIRLEGTSYSTVSNDEGVFSLKFETAERPTHLIVSYLGYRSARLALSGVSQLNGELSVGLLSDSIRLEGVDVNSPEDAKSIVLKMLDNYDAMKPLRPKTAISFFRERINRRNRNLSITEAVIELQKDHLKEGLNGAYVIESRKRNDYKPLDTIALKLQGGPYNLIYLDLLSHRNDILDDESFDQYLFTLTGKVRYNGEDVYIVHFEQRSEIFDPLYKGDLYITVDKHRLSKANFELNITNSEQAAKLFVRKKPKTLRIEPTKVAYRIDYQTARDEPVLVYADLQMDFNVNWRNRLFNRNYTVLAEMAFTRWDDAKREEVKPRNERLRPTVIMADSESGFSDPNFWRNYNVIEPDQDIETILKRIERQLRRSR